MSQRANLSAELDRREFLRLAAAVGLGTSLLACGGTSTSPSSSASGGTARVALGFGLVFSSMYVVQQRNLLDKYQKGAKIVQTTLASGASTADALIAGQIDIGVQAIPPFLIAWDKGADFRIGAGLAYNPVHLVTWKSDIHSIRDFKPGDKIALPSPTSGEAVFLSYAAKTELGNANALKQNFVALSEPDSQTALTSHQVAAHFATLPYYQQELATPGNHEITTDAEILGFKPVDVVMVVSKSFFDQQRPLYNAFIKALQEATDYVLKDPDGTSQVMSPILKTPAADLKGQLQLIGWNSIPTGIGQLASTMKDIGLISKTPPKLDDVTWDNLHGTKMS